MRNLFSFKVTVFSDVAFMALRLLLNGVHCGPLPRESTYTKVARDGEQARLVQCPDIFL